MSRIALSEMSAPRCDKNVQKSALFSAKWILHLNLSEHFPPGFFVSETLTLNWKLLKNQCKTPETPNSLDFTHPKRRSLGFSFSLHIYIIPCRHFQKCKIENQPSRCTFMPQNRGKRHSEAMAKTPFSFVLVPVFVNRRMEGSVSRKVNSV